RMTIAKAIVREPAEIVPSEIRQKEERDVVSRVRRRRRGMQVDEQHPFVFEDRNVLLGNRIDTLERERAVARLMVFVKRRTQQAAPPGVPAAVPQIYRG